MESSTHRLEVRQWRVHRVIQHHGSEQSYVGIEALHYRTNICTSTEVALCSSTQRTKETSVWSCLFELPSIALFKSVAEYHVLAWHWV